MTHKPKSRWRWLKRLFILFLLIGLGGAGYGFAVYKRYSRDLPTLNGLADYHPSLVTRVFARDYQLLGEFYIERRQFVPREEVPEILINAFLAIEDSRFYEHYGVDPVGLFRAALANFQAGRIVQGASTITQQVAKTFLLSSERTVKRKIQEIILALRIEQRFSKDEILELYVNQIYLGAGAYGVGAASRIYFNRDVSELTLGQAALLAGLPKAPSRYDPWRFPERARRRQVLVLKRMAEVGYITQAEMQAAIDAPLGLARARIPLEQVAPHFLEHVRRTVRREWGARNLYRGGLDIFTTLDPRLQRAAQAAVRRGLIAYDRRHGYRGALAHLDSVDAEARAAWLTQAQAEFEPRRDLEQVGVYLRGLVVGLAENGQQAQVLTVHGEEGVIPFAGLKWARDRVGEWKSLGPVLHRVQDRLAVGDVILLEPSGEEQGAYLLAQEPDAEGALVSMDPHTGELLALVGGYDFERSEFNRATQGVRQPGSAFKPLLYAAGLEINGMTPATRIDDSPIPLRYRDPVTGEEKVWRAQNYGHHFRGPTTLRVALEKSSNLVTIRLVKNMGLSRVIPFLARFGMAIPDSRRDLTLALGSVGFTPLAMTAAYGVFANGGKLIDPVYISRVQDRFGRTVHRSRGGDCLLCHQEPVAAAIEAPPENRVPSPYGERRLSPETAFQITTMLKGVITNGTGRRARVLNRPLAGKTGTTDDMRDAWFMGFSPSVVTGVWVGHDDNTTLGRRETGAQAALPIWIDYMEAALRDRPVTDFPAPAGIQLIPTDPATGRVPQPGAARIVMEAYKLDEGPDPAAGGVAAGPMSREVEIDYYE